MNNIEKDIQETKDKIVIWEGKMELAEENGDLVERARCDATIHDLRALLTQQTAKEVALIQGSYCFVIFNN